MTFTSGTSQSRATAPSESLSVPIDRVGEELEPPRRDWKKIVLIAGLASLSWVATYVGMLELIQSNLGSLPLTHKLIIGFSVAMLMTMIVWLLDQLFAPIDRFTKAAYVGGYIFLTIISVGFGFGFYWKVLESRSESSRSAVSAVSQVQSSLYAASTRLEQLQSTLVQLSTISTEKAELERTKGTSCPNSSPGDGPRRKMRDDDASRFTFASNFVKGRVGSIKTDMAGLDTELAKISGNDRSIIDPKTGTRNEFMRGLGRRLDLTVTGFNAFRTDPQLRQIRTDLADRAERTTIPNGRGGAISCPDPQLQMALRGVVRAIDQLPVLDKPEIAAVEGAEATIEAFRRLTATFYGLMSLELPLSADELRALQQKAVQSIENPAVLQALKNEAAGLSKRDYIPLGVAFFVDLCLLLVSIGRPMNRFVETRRMMLEAERGPVFPILSRFNEIHNHEDMRRTFDVFREVIFESSGTYYVAVPLNAPRHHPQREQLKLDGQTLANLCYALEGQGVLTRPWKLTPSLVARRKLRRQGSKFIECYRDSRVAPFPRAWRALKGLFFSGDDTDDTAAFRIYAFKRGAWPEMILGAVMGAAGRMEAERRVQPQVAQPATVSEPASSSFSVSADKPAWELADVEDVPTEPDAPTSEPLKNGHAVPTPDRGREHGEPADMESELSGEIPFFLQPDVTSPSRRPHGNSAFRQQFGSYASQAEAELATYRDDDDSAALDEVDQDQPKSDADGRSLETAANSNTSPSRRTAKPPEDIVVPFPAPTRSAPAPREPQDGLTGSLVTTLEIPEPPDELAGTRQTIGVELRRETATFRVPVSQASLPQTLAKLNKHALEMARLGDSAPQLELSLPTPAITDAAPKTRPASEHENDIVEPSDPQEQVGFEPPLVLRKIVD